MKKVAELRAELKTHGLNTKGTKAELEAFWQLLLVCRHIHHRTRRPISLSLSWCSHGGHWRLAAAAVHDTPFKALANHHTLSL